MADQCIIIEGSVKYRDGRKWKPRWCVMRKLSPVADCVHLLLYRDARARWAAGGGGGGDDGGGAGVKAALSLARCVGVQECAGVGAAAAGGEAPALALLCRDAVHVLALDSRDRLQHWLSAVAAALRSRSFEVVSAGVGAGAGARLHVSRGCVALAGGGGSVGGAPRLLLVWEVSALRRFGADGDRLVLEGGAGCGRGAGVHVLRTARAAEAAAALRHQAALQLTMTSTGSELACNIPAVQRPDSLRLGPTRLDSSRRGSDTSLDGGGGGGETLSRCRSCMSKLGLTPLLPTAAFTPAWSMPPLPRSCSAYPRDHYAADNYDVPKLPSAEAEDEYYDTPKRIKECLGGEDSGRASPELCRIERRACGCVVRRRVIGGGGGGGGVCACRRVTDWAQGWLRRSPAPTPAPLYATVDLSRKSRRPAPHADYENLHFSPAPSAVYENAREWRERLRGAGDEDAGCDYLPMEPRAPPAAAAAAASYAAMSPPRPLPRGEVRRCASVPGCRHSSSSNDSGVSLCSPPPHPAARRSRSTEARGPRAGVEAKSSSAEAAVPVRAGNSSSSGASDMSDYIETLSLCSSHSSGDPPPAPRAATTLRPRAGAEYHPRPSPAPPLARY